MEQKMDRAHDDAMAEAFRADPAHAVRLLNNILADGCQDELLILLRQMTKAFRGMSKVDDQARFGRTSIDLMPPTNANLEICSLKTILKMMGLRLVVQSIKQRHRDDVVADFCGRHMSMNPCTTIYAWET